MNRLSIDHSPNMFLGVGPGRCGTRSLAKVLDAQPWVVCHHEQYNHTKAKTLDVVAMLNRFQLHTSHKVGEVGYIWLTVARVLRLQYPTLPIICLHRDKYEVVESFMRRCVRKHKPWVLNFEGVVEDPDESFFADHWDWTEHEMAQLADPVFHMRTEDLNDDAMLDAVMDFLGLPAEGRVYPDERRYNLGDEAAARRLDRWRVA